MRNRSQSTSAPRNRTLRLSVEEQRRYQRHLLRLSGRVKSEEICNRTINQELSEILDYLPPCFVDLLFLDPPYNLTKTFGATAFKERSTEDYKHWLEGWFSKLLGTLKPTASVYICGDWRSAAAIQVVASKYLNIRNRITWEREKGRGSRSNWKSCSEDIWFCTVSENYTFNVDAVKLMRRVIAPYTGADGKPKDWEKTATGNYRQTNPSNLWTDITVPFWSMPENTQHPTQKPEKLLAKIILASTNPSDVVLDVFLGSGTSSVVAKKLGRTFVGIEVDSHYCALAEKRLALAENDKTIQGFTDGVFWERNSLQDRRSALKNHDFLESLPLFDRCSDWES